MSLSSYIFLVAFAVFFFSLFKKGTDIFSPARLFIMIWLLALGLAEMKLSRHQIEWSNYSWFMILISVLSALLGVFVVYVINFKKPLKSLNEIRNELIHFNFNKKLFFRLIIILFLVYMGSYLIIYLVKGYIPFFTSDPNSTRTKWSLFGFGLIIHIAPTIIYLIVVFYLYIKINLAVKVFLFSLLFLTISSFFLLLSRFDLVISIILSIVLLFYGTYKFRAKYLFLLVTILVALMYGVSTIRTSRFFIEYLYYTAQMKYSLKYAFLTEPYMYVVMNLENFANAVDKLTQFTFGYFSFDFLLALSGLKHWIAGNVIIKDFPFILNNDYNTYTMFFIYYRDFGVFGLFVIPFLWGFIFSYLYYKVRRFPNINTISIYGMFIFVSIFSFFIPMLSWLHFEFNLFMIYFLTKKLIDAQTTPKMELMHNS